jgi:hypothetical protein
LTGMSKPDHNTINRFRSDKLKGQIKKVFTQIVLMMAESGHVDLQSVYTDGTKIESIANRYTFVWGKRIKSSKERIASQLEELWDYTQKVASEELKDTTTLEFESLAPEVVKETVSKIDKALKGKPVSKKIKAKVRYAKRHWSKNLQKYNDAEKILGERNSYSKTDADATFMRMKEDHLENSQLKPAYNVQISTNKQVITHYSLHQNPADTRTLKPHLESFRNAYNFLPQELTADAGYGSEENYEFLEQAHVEAYVKYNYFDKEQKTRYRGPSEFHHENLFYNKEKNCYYCPMGQQMNYTGSYPEKTEAGYTRTISRYEVRNCKGCPMQGVCHNREGNRIIEVSHRLNELRDKARDRLLSEQGLKHRSKRSVDVEPVFGMIKHNRGFKRFTLKGLQKIEVEFGLLALAHNIKKMA